MDCEPINIKINKYLINKIHEILKNQLLFDIICIITTYFNQTTIKYSRNSTNYNICEILDYEFTFKGINYFGMVNKLILNAKPSLIISRTKYIAVSEIINCFLEKYHKRENNFSVRQNAYLYEFATDLCECGINIESRKNKKNIDIIHGTGLDGIVICATFLKTNSFLKAIDILEDFIINDYPYMFI